MTPSSTDGPVVAAAQWPVLRDPAQSVVGLYGGIVSAYSPRGDLESATLLILPTGYVAPILGGGDLAVFPVTYFDQPGCSGRQYLSPVGTQTGLLPLPGMVYRSSATGQISYIAQARVPTTTHVRSRLRIDAQQAVACETLDQIMPLLAVDENDPAVTGMNRAGTFGALGIGVETAAGSRKRDHRLGGGMGAGATPETATSAPELEPQAECSPGCLEEAVGNGACDIPCYVESCRYDGGDCTAMSQDELDKALAEMCSPGCNRADIGDGFCDTACRTAACDQDGGDCSEAGRER